MRHAPRFGLLLCILFHAAVAGAAKRPIGPVNFSSPDAAAPGLNALPGLPSIPSSVYPYYQTLKNYTFDNAGAPDTQGWTTYDLTAQTGTYWHVDNFTGLSDRKSVV